MKHFFSGRQYTDEKGHFILLENEVIKNYIILKLVKAHTEKYVWQLIISIMKMLF